MNDREYKIDLYGFEAWLRSDRNLSDRTINGYMDRMAMLIYTAKVKREGAYTFRKQCVRMS